MASADRFSRPASRASRGRPLDSSAASSTRRRCATKGLIPMAHIQDRWERTIDGERVRITRYGKGKRWQARYRDPDGHERALALRGV